MVAREANDAARVDSGRGSRLTALRPRGSAGGASSRASRVILAEDSLLDPSALSVKPSEASTLASDVLSPRAAGTPPAGRTSLHARLQRGLLKQLSTGRRRSGHSPAASGGLESARSPGSEVAAAQLHGQMQNLPTAAPLSDVGPQPSLSGCPPVRPPHKNSHGGAASPRTPPALTLGLQSPATRSPVLRAGSAASAGDRLCGGSPLSSKRAADVLGSAGSPCASFHASECATDADAGELAGRLLSPVPAGSSPVEEGPARQGSRLWPALTAHGSLALSSALRGTSSTAAAAPALTPRPSDAASGARGSWARSLAPDGHTAAAEARELMKDSDAPVVLLPSGRELRWDRSATALTNEGRAGGAGAEALRAPGGVEVILDAVWVTCRGRPVCAVPVRLAASK